jgi:hypothetical protein
MDILKCIRNKRFQNEVAKWFYHGLCGALGGPVEGYLPLTDEKNSPVSLRTAEPLNQEEP